MTEAHQTLLLALCELAAVLGIVGWSWWQCFGYDQRERRRAARRLDTLQRQLDLEDECERWRR